MIGGDQRDVVLDLGRLRVVDDEVRGLDAAAELVGDLLGVDRVAERARVEVQQHRRRAAATSATTQRADAAPRPGAARAITR